MNMKFWKPKYSVCEECKVHFEPATFEPATESESEWGHLCPTHRKPIMERDLKRRAVMTWARLNWERLAEMMEKESANTHELSYMSLQGRQAAAQKEMAQAQNQHP